MTLVDTVIKYIESQKESLIDWLCKYIEFRSTTEKEIEAQQWLNEEFRGFGIFDKVDYWSVDNKLERPNVVGIIKGKRIQLSWSGCIGR